MSDAQGNTPPGWYPAGDVLRYWDGRQWTEHTAPLTQSNSPAPPTDPKAEKRARREAKQAELRAKLDAARADRVAAISDRQDIQDAMARMSSKLGSKREIRRLPEHLWPGERVDLLASGTYGPGTGILVLTDRRMIFLKDGITSKVSEDFPIDKVSSVQWHSGMLLGTITIFASGNKAEIKNVQKGDGKALTDAVRGRISGLSTGPAPIADVPQPGAYAPPTQPPASSNAHERLRRVADLHRDGILTDEEFAAKKAQILGEL